MAGIYIPGLDLSDMRSRRALFKEQDGKVKIILETAESYSERDVKIYPVIAVPDHGRLVDADAFRKEMDKHYPFDKLTQSKHGEADAAKGTILLMLAEAPTIIPADKEVQTC